MEKAKRHEKDKIYIKALNELSKEFVNYKIDENEFRIGFRKIIEEWKNVCQSN